jgi:hypothetical protein
LEGNKQNKLPISVYFFTIVLIVSFGSVIWYLLQDSTQTEKIKDTMVILFTLEMLVIGIATVILIVQFAKLFNLVQNEVKPLLASANETIKTIKDTTEFISESISKPVIQFNTYFSGFKKLMETISSYVGKI